MSGKRVSQLILGTVWPLFCSEPKVALGMRPKGLIAGTICLSPARGPGDTKVPFAGQAAGGAQFPAVELLEGPLPAGDLRRALRAGLQVLGQLASRLPR